MNDLDLARRLGAMLAEAPLEDPFEYRYMFDLTGVTFLQKLVPKRIMEAKLNLAPEGFMRTLLVLDFFTTAVAGSDAVLDNLRLIYKRLLKKDGRKNPIPEGLVVVELGLYAREEALDPDVAAVRARLGTPVALAGDGVAVDPFYEGMGFMLLDQLPRREGAERIRCKADYKAAVFAGAMLSRGGAGEAKVLESLRRGDFLEAALEALGALREAVRIEDVQSFVP